VATRGAKTKSRAEAERKGGDGESLDAGRDEEAEMGGEGRVGGVGDGDWRGCGGVGRDGCARRRWSAEERRTEGCERREEGSGSGG
jgi:hypothetical protein